MTKRANATDPEHLGPGKRTARELTIAASACLAAHVLVKDEVVPRELLIVSSFCLNDSIVLVVALSKSEASFVPLILRVMTLPSIVQVPRMVPVTPWSSVLLMNPPGMTLETNLPSAPNEIVSFVSPTVPIQSPTIVVAYCASGTGAPSRAHDEKPDANVSASRVNRMMFIKAFANSDHMSGRVNVARLRRWRLSDQSRVSAGSNCGPRYPLLHRAPFARCRPWTLNLKLRGVDVHRQRVSGTQNNCAKGCCANLERPTASVNVDGRFHYYRILGPHMANETPE
jgi:hypothetical protein